MRPQASRNFLGQTFSKEGRKAGLTLFNFEGISLKVNDDHIRGSDLQGVFRHREGEKSKEYFVCFKISRQTRGGKRPKSAKRHMISVCFLAP